MTDSKKPDAAQCGVQTVEPTMHTIVEAFNDWSYYKYEDAQVSFIAGAKWALALSSAAPACTCGGDMAHDYHQDWCPAVSFTHRGSE